MFFWEIKIFIPAYTMVGIFIAQFQITKVNIFPSKKKLIALVERKYNDDEFKKNYKRRNYKVFKWRSWLMLFDSESNNYYGWFSLYQNKMGHAGLSLNY